MKRFYILPTIFWEVDNNGDGRFVVAWLIGYVEIGFHIRAKEESVSK